MRARAGCPARIRPLSRRIRRRAAARHPVLPRSAPAPHRGAGRPRSTARSRHARRSHVRDDVRGAGHRARRHPGQRAPAHRRHRRLRGERQPADADQPRAPARRGGGRDAGGLPVHSGASTRRSRDPRQGSPRRRSVATAEPFELDAEGLLAVCVQHEIDHLDGQASSSITCRRSSATASAARWRRRRATGNWDSTTTSRDMPEGQPLRVAFAGTPAFARVSLEALIGGEHEVVGVLTQPDRRAGRGRQLTASPVKVLALEHALPVLQPAHPARRAGARGAGRAASGRARRRRLRADPARRGARAAGARLPERATPRCCRAGAGRRRCSARSSPATPETGVCIMQMDTGLDTRRGSSPARARLDRRRRERERAHRAPGPSSVPRRSLAPALAGRRRDGTLAAEPQPEAGVTYADKLDKGEAPLDFSRPAHELHRRVRALHGWPVAESTLEGERVRLWRSALPGGRRRGPDRPPRLRARRRPGPSWPRTPAR